MKDGDRYILKFPVKMQYCTNPTMIETIGKVAKKIKDNVFPGNAYSFEMTDEKLNAVKTFDY
jgi:hypothetical protein